MITPTFDAALKGLIALWRAQVERKPHRPYKDVDDDSAWYWEQRRADLERDHYRERMYKDPNDPV